LPETAAEWIEREMQWRVRDNSAHIEKLGLEDVRQLKTEVSEVVQKLPAVAENLLGDKSRWPHRRAPSARDPSGESFFDNVIREMASTLGPVLERHGLIQDAPGHVSSWQRVGGAKWRYAISLGLEKDELSEVSSAYHNMFLRLKRVEESLGSERTAASQQRAQELWDKS
jgi:hypothetical protein